MSSRCPRDPGVEALSTTRGAVLPFLPTLVTALVVAAASLLCRPPSAPEVPPAPSMTTQAGADGFHHAGAATAVSVPAVVAFARLQPPALQAEAAIETDNAARPATRPARLATAAGRRPCTGGRCESRRPDAVRSAAGAARPAAETSAPLPFAPVAEPDTDEGLPDDALPFAPTAVSWAETVRTVGARIGGRVGSEAASLGGSVVDLIACAR